MTLVALGSYALAGKDYDKVSSGSHFDHRLLPPCVPRRSLLAKAGAAGAEDWREKRAFPANLLHPRLKAAGVLGQNENCCKVSRTRPETGNRNPEPIIFN